MPLTKNALNHIKIAYRRGWALRTTSVTLYFQTRGPVTIQAIWHSSDTADPEYGPHAPASIAATTQSADAAFEALTDDVPISLLEQVTHVQLAQGFGRPDPSPSLGAHYLIVAIQPKGSAFPPNRCYVLLRRV